MHRIDEELKIVSLMAPASVDSATETPTDYVDASGSARLEIAILTAGLSAAKVLQCDVYNAGDSAGTNAVKLNDGAFTVAADVTKGAFIVSVNVSGDRKEFYAVKFQHDQGAAVVCAAVAMLDEVYRPADNDYVIRV